MKKKILNVLILSLIIILSVPVFSYAQETEDGYIFLAPLAGLKKVSRDHALQEYIPFIFKLLIGLSAVFAVLSIVVGGFQYISTDAFQKKSEGKARIKNSILGLILVIGSWLILHTINPDLLEINLELETPVMEEMPESSGSLRPGGSRVATGADLLSGTSLAADESIRKQLESAGIKINNPPCTADRTSNCTNLNGLPQSTIITLAALKLDCSNYHGSDCPIVITAGTETSLHNKGTAHRPGNGVIDLRPTPKLNAYLGNTSPKDGEQIVKNGFKFTYEVIGSNPASTADHWHVVTQ
ncbi:MAG: DUF1345 domain-containing protein [Parcubacteria group bacterium]|jgi:hypothetical protein|nr:DUF1345 domain-containing protein [Parcubacteria group bacterium]